MIAVFAEFGIPITGSQKLRRFYSEIPVDRFDVEGILFELELRLGVLLEEKVSQQISSPADVIRTFARN